VHPGQDERDWEFAEKFNLPIIRTVQPPSDFTSKAYLEDGPAINSEFLNGLYVDAAKKNLVKIPVINGTIPHEQLAKFGGANVLLKPASHGTGVKAGGAMRAVLESVGIHDILAKSKGSSNPHNLVKATFGALLGLRDAYTVAEQRGVSLDKVFKG